MLERLIARSFLFFSLSIIWVSTIRNIPENFKNCVFQAVTFIRIYRISCIVHASVVKSMGMKLISQLCDCVGFVMSMIKLQNSIEYWILYFLSDILFLFNQWNLLCKTNCLYMASWVIFSFPSVPAWSTGFF